MRNAFFAGVVLSVLVVTPVEAAQIEEVVVTAQKREERLQDVPIALSVVDGESMASLDYANVADLQYVVPSVKFAEGVHPRGEGFAIRGVGSSTFAETVEGSVGVVVDGVVMGQQGAGVFDFADLARVEVLRGPQGMLFGKNATAGILNIVTNRPDLQSSSYSLRASGSFRDDDFENKLEGVANFALSDRVALRLVGVRTDRDDFVKNVFPGGRDAHGLEEWGLKSKLLWQASENLDVYFTADYAERDSSCCIWTTRIAPAGNTIVDAQAPVVASPHNERINQNAPSYHDMKHYGAALELEYDWGDYVITSITSAREWQIDLNADTDQQPINVFDRNFGDSEHQQFTQEIRIASPAGERFEYVAGLYYFYQDSESFTSQVFVVPGVTSLGRDARILWDTENFAPFVNLTVNVSDRLRLIAGGRYTFEKLDGDFDRVITPGSPLPLTVPTPFAFEFDTDMEEPSWRFGVQYDAADEVMVYATATRGVKGPSANILADFNSDDPDLILVDPEKATSYELGLKGAWLDNRLVVNLALFDTTFKDFQAQTLDRNAEPAIYRIANAGKLSTRGVEVDFTAVPAEGLTLTGAVAYVDAEFDDFRTSCWPFQTEEQGCVAGPGGSDTDAAGNALNGSPEWTASLTARYERPVGRRLAWHVQGNYFWQDDVNFSANGDPTTVQDAYGLFNLNVGIGRADGLWRVSAFVRNLFDEHFVGSVFGTPLFASPPQPAPSYSQMPVWNSERILGLSLEINY
ncbi:MAG TPA: TonB-dependent receptor [Pseudomonadales bacterium]